MAKGKTNYGTADRAMPNTGGWQDRHDAAWGLIDTGVTNTAIGWTPELMQRNQEKTLVAMLKGWHGYAITHKKTYGTVIGDDGFLGPQWLAAGIALRALLNGTTGRLDCGTVDVFILDTLFANGFSEGDL